MAPTWLNCSWGKGYEVHGIKRRTSLFNTDRIDHLYLDPHEPNPPFRLHYGDLTDPNEPHPVIVVRCNPTKSIT